MAELSQKGFLRQERLKGDISFYVVNVPAVQNDIHPSRITGCTGGLTLDMALDIKLTSNYYYVVQLAS